MTENEHMIVIRAKPLVAEHEGFENQVYRDSVGVPTIGYGFALKDVAPEKLKTEFYMKNPRNTGAEWSDKSERDFWNLCFADGVPEIVSDDEYEYLTSRLYCSRIVGDALLLTKLQRFYVELTTAHPWVKNLDKARQVALLDMIYNLGLPGFSLFKKTIELLKNGDYENAALEMLNSKWAFQVGHRSWSLAGIIKYGVFDIPYRFAPIPRD